MRNLAFDQFFRADYQLAAASFQSLPDRYCREHYILSLFLNDPNSDIEAVRAEVINLEALRQEAGFSYSCALSLRHSIHQKNADIINTLAICDINLKVNPLNDYVLELVQQFSYNDRYNLLEVKIISFRLINILRQVANNHDISVVDHRLAFVCHEFLSGFQRRYPSIDTYCNLAQYYYFLKDFDQSYYYYKQAQNLFGESEKILLGLSSIAFECSNSLEGIELLEKLLQISPDNPEYNTSYGITLEIYGKSNEALKFLEKAVEVISSQVRYSITIANQFRKIGNIALAEKFYYQVVNLITCYHDSWLNLSRFAIWRKQLDSAKSYMQYSILSIPESSSAMIIASDLLDMQGQLSDAINLLERAYRNSPTNWEVAIRLIQKLQQQKEPLKALNICQNFAQINSDTYRLRCSTALSRLYLDLGLTIPLFETLDKLQELILKESPNTSWKEWMYVYHILSFVVPSVRDSTLFNSLIFSLVSEKYVDRLNSWACVMTKLYGFDFKAPKYTCKYKIKRIGFVSPNFSGHVVSELSIDIIKELSTLSDDIEVFIIPIDLKCQNSEFLKKVRQQLTPTLKLLELYYPLPNIVEHLIKLELDVLIELDGATSEITCQVLYCHPAQINLSWLGFDAPFISEQNFFLCDQYTHPDGIDELYKEKLIRLPNSHMCVRGFEVVEKNRSEVRQSLGISDSQILFIYTAAVRKFNFDTASAHAQILLQVPNSILLVKTSLGTLDIPLEVWREEVKKLGLNPDRVMPLKYVPTQEEHRFYFKVADIYLDAYPYNGGSQTLEALWCELPVVTYCGEQSFARMGYSLLSTLGITDCIAHSWEEYIEWAVRLATDRDLYQKIKHRLWEAKQPETLSPLWNPKQFARDMYNILQELYQNAVSESS